MIDVHVDAFVVGNDMEISAGTSCSLHSDLAGDEEIRRVLRVNGCPDQFLSSRAAAESGGAPLAAGPADGRR